MLSDAELIKLRLRRQQVKDDRNAVHTALIKEMHSRALPDSFDLTPNQPKKSGRKLQKAKPATPNITKITKPQLCKKCGLPIGFKKVGDKWHPTNVDGSDHWDDCSKAKRDGRSFNPKTDTQSSGLIRGIQFKETNCDCIPWVVCDKCKIMNNINAGGVSGKICAPIQKG